MITMTMSMMVSSGWQIFLITTIIITTNQVGGVPLENNQQKHNDDNNNNNDGIMLNDDNNNNNDGTRIGIIPRVYFINATIPTNITHRNLTEEEIYWMIRNRTRDNWLEMLKAKILRHLGRSNLTTTTITTKSEQQQQQQLAALNLTTVLPNFLNVTQSINNDDFITEKIRSYYPSCEIPLNTDEDSWKDENIMNLYFNFQQLADDRGLNIATATLRLYRLPNNENNTTNLSMKLTDCGDNTNLNDEDRLLRVSIYWYTKSLKKRRVKRRLSDSKVIAESARWVELSVKPATRAWTRGRNLGLAILVEDQEGNILKADKYFKGASCMVGMSTPKPIPTIIMDRIRASSNNNNKFNNIYSIFGRNATSPITSDIFMLPIIDICTLEFPENYTTSPFYNNYNNNNNNNNNGQYLNNLRINACNLNKLHDQNQYHLEKERLERLALLPDLLQQQQQHLRHIRHQRQHQSRHSNNNNNDSDNNNNNEYDPRSRIINKRVLTTEELQNLNLDNLTMSRVDR